MHVLISISGGIMLALALLYAARPEALTRLEWAKGNSGLAIAVLSNVILGTLFIIAAPEA